MATREAEIRPEVDVTDQLFRIFSDARLKPYATPVVAKIASEIIPEYLPAYKTWDSQKQSKFVSQLLWSAGQQPNPTGLTNEQNVRQIMAAHAETAGHKVSWQESAASTLRATAEIGGALLPQARGIKASITAASKVPAAIQLARESPTLLKAATRFLAPTTAAATGAAAAVGATRPVESALLAGAGREPVETAPEAMLVAGERAIGGEIGARVLTGIGKFLWQGGRHPIRMAVARRMAETFQKPHMAMGPETIEGLQILREQGVEPLAPMLSSNARVQFRLGMTSLAAGKRSWVANVLPGGGRTVAREFEVMEAVHQSTQNLIDDIVNASGANWTRQTLYDPEQLANEIHRLISDEREFASIAGSNLYQGIDSVLAQVGNPNVIVPDHVQSWFAKMSLSSIHLQPLRARLLKSMSTKQLERSGFRFPPTEEEIEQAFEAGTDEALAQDATFYDMFMLRSTLLKIGRGPNSDPVVRLAHTLVPKVTQILKEQSDNIQPGLFDQFAEASTFWRKNAERLRNRLINKFMDTIDPKVGGQASNFIKIVDSLSLADIKAIRKAMGPGKAGKELFEQKFQNMAALSVLYRSADKATYLTPGSTPGLFRIDPLTFVNEVMQLPIGRGPALYGKLNLDRMKRIANAYQLASRTVENPGGVAMLLQERATASRVIEAAATPSKADSMSLFGRVSLALTPYTAESIFASEELTKLVVQFMASPPKSLRYEAALKGLMQGLGQGMLIRATLPDPISRQTEMMLDPKISDAFDQHLVGAPTQ